MRLRFRIILAAILAAGPAGSSLLRAQQDAEAPTAAEGMGRLLSRSRVIVNGALFEAATYTRASEEAEMPAAEALRLPVQARLSIVNFNDAVFGRSRSTATLDANDERQRLDDILAGKVADVDRLCELTAAQKQKLELAGRGDVYRLFERVEELRRKCQNTVEHGREQNSMTLLLEWARDLSREIQPLKAELAQGPFGEASLFAKTLRGMLTPGQLTEWRRMPSAVSTKSQLTVASVGPDAAFTKAERDIRLSEILAEWEAAAARIERLDCQFTRFRYDPAFQVEWRGTGALAVDKSGRAMYRIGPEPIIPGAVGRKLARNGAPYDLKSSPEERWHWTGKRVVHIDEEARMYEELRLSPKRKQKESQPDPPPLPEDAVLGTAARNVDRAPPVPGNANAPGRAPGAGELFASAAFGFGIGAGLSKADWLESLFPIPRPFLLRTTVAELKIRFHVELTKETDTQIWLRMVPKLQKEQANFSEAVLILSPGLYRPIAVKIVDPTNAETVHVFKNAQINPRGIVEDLERPNLDGYRRVN